MNVQGCVCAIRLSLLFSAILFISLGSFTVDAVAPVDGSGGTTAQQQRRLMKQMDMPDPLEWARVKQRVKWMKAQRAARARTGDSLALSSEPSLYGKSGVDRVLVILVEFEGTNTFTWTPGVSTWDPLGRCDNSEYDGANLANSTASQFFANKYGITAPTNFTYSGPLHNQIARPLGSNDASSVMIWQPDFSGSYYSNIIFGNGVVFDYARQDGSTVHEDFSGCSVRDYYEDLSAGAYSITGNILGWVRVTNSIWYYGGDGLPGARSCSQRPAFMGAIPGGGDARTLVIDALRAAKAAYPGFDWASYDQNHDGTIDRLWIIHAGLGEEDNPAFLNATTYGEGGMWSHSWALGSAYEVVPGVSANSYIMMPENAGIAVLAHEFGHNLGAIDLYTYGDGQTSAGFWTLMSDSWTGFPLGFLPEGMDPMHLDWWGWLEPAIISDPSRAYTVRLGQASRFQAGGNLSRGVKIDLPDGIVALSARPRGQYFWWGGKEDLIDSRMTMKAPVKIPSGGATLEFYRAYDLESSYDYFYVQVSTNLGGSWQNLGSYTGTSAGYPALSLVSYSLSAQAGKDVLIRFRYTTDNYTTGEGPFIDDIVIRSSEQSLFADDAEQERDLWTYTLPWSRNNGYNPAGYSHNYYLQWRNTTVSGGYDRALGDARFRFGPVNTGLIVWYQDDRYGDNSIFNYLNDSPSFGPKGKLLVLDAHPEPELDPYWVAQGITNERGNVFSRGSMRDAPFSRWPTLAYHLDPPYAYQAADFAGRAAEPLFSDATGYYPGIEQIGSNLWRTRQWDASVVIPAAAYYDVRGQGYTPGTPLDQIISSRSYVGTAETMLYRTNVMWGGLGQTGGDGNPGTIDAALGWNVRVVWQTNEWAEVVVWNSQYATLDDDNDGVPNWQEALAGTNPADSTSFLSITRVERDPAGIRLEWTSATNRTYRLERASALPSGFNTTVATGIASTPPTNTFIDTTASADAAYYRVRLD